ncbi:MAG: hypothetical protein ABIO37_00670 [Caulobacteraceae bacterium]
MAVQPEQLKRRELVVRVATLELLVADLVHLMRRIAPAEVDTLLAEALVDRDAQMSHDMIGDAEAQRYRLHQVFEERCRQLKNKRFGGPHRNPSHSTD